MTTFLSFFAAENDTGTARVSDRSFSRSRSE